jgi:hypothetical protein
MSSGEEIKWTDTGASISIRNALIEFPILTFGLVREAMKDFRLEQRQGYFMGKTYTKLLRHQVVQLVKDMKTARNETDDTGNAPSTSREQSFNDKGASMSEKNAIKEYAGTNLEMIIVLT